MSSVRHSRIACVNGFLGAGKTTLILWAAHDLLNRGLRMAIITNDQGGGLVDTARVRDAGFPVEEIAGGCFCCRFREFLESAHMVVEQYRPDIILAEAVGSCTDLAATVHRRLRQYAFELGPLTVLVEPDRIRELSGPRTPFNDSIKYLFAQQLAEADLVMLNKCDLVDIHEIAGYHEQLRTHIGDIPISAVSAQTGEGVRAWVDQLLTGKPGRRELHVDYELYAAAEASLGWLNATVDMVSSRAFAAKEIGEQLLTRIQQFYLGVGRAIAHVKIMVLTSEGNDCLALTNSAGVGTWGKSRDLPAANEASLIVNARISTTPGELRKFFEDSVASVASVSGLRYVVHGLECFSPQAPKRDSAIPAFDSAT
jgi:G3E family GTPase